MCVWCATILTILGFAAGACVPDERPGEAPAEVTVRSSFSAPAGVAPQSRSQIARTLSRREGRESTRQLEQPFFDDFDRALLGSNYRKTSRAWRIEDGQLCVSDALNHPVWLKLRLPTNVRIEFDATSHSEDGDIKFEIFGDGRSFARNPSYTDASGYVLIFGGWKNTLHVLARQDEHGGDRLELATRAGAANPIQKPVAPGQRYRFEVERTDGKSVRWLVDGKQVHVFRDSAPLVGRGHEYFGFNDWAARVCFDNLAVTPLKDG